MVGIPLSQPAPSPSSGTCVRVVSRQVVAESAFAFLAGPLSQAGLEGAVVAAVDQEKDIDSKPSDLLHVTLISTNNHNY